MWSDGAPGTGGAAGGGAGARALPAGQAGSFWPRRTRRSPCRSARWQVTASPRRAGPPWARGEPGKQPRWHEVHGRGHETVPHADEARFHRELLMQALRNYPAILSGNSLTAVVQTIKGLRKRKQITSHTQGLRVACGRDGGAAGPAGSGAAGERTPCPAGATARPSAPAGRPPARGREGRAQLRRCRTADHLLASRGLSTGVAFAGRDRGKRTSGGLTCLATLALMPGGLLPYRVCPKQTHDWHRVGWPCHLVLGAGIRLLHRAVPD